MLVPPGTTIEMTMDILTGELKIEKNKDGVVIYYKINSIDEEFSISKFNQSIREALFKMFGTTLSIEEVKELTENSLSGLITERRNIKIDKILDHPFNHHCSFTFY